MTRNTTIRDYLLIAILAAIAFIPFIGRVNLFDWDEINFAECAREMIVTRDYLTVQIDFKPFWEKPPLFIWMQVLSMKAFGINEFASRLPNALCGVISLMVLYGIGKKLKGRTFGLWWVLIYAGSILPQFYFRSGIIDPWFNLFIFLSAWFFSLFSFGTWTRKWAMAALSGFFAGLAVLTKGPTALLILGLVIAIFYIPVLYRLIFSPSRSEAKSIPWTELGIFAFFALITGGFWFLLQVLNGHGDMVVKFIMYQVRLFTIPDAGHGGHWSYHIWVLLLGVFPASIFALRSLRIDKEEAAFTRHFQFIMLILFWVVLILFSIVKTKIIHYSSLCYFPLTYLAAMTVNALVEGKKKVRKSSNVLLIVISSLVAFVVMAIPVLMMFKQQLLSLITIKDEFALANLQADVHWGGWESLIGVILIVGISAGVLMLRRMTSKGLVLIFTTGFLFTWATMMVFPYRIEQYSQRTAIEFFKEKAKEDCYVLNAGYFSYAPLFYGQKMPEDVRRPMWLLTATLDRPFYLVLKEPEYKEWRHIIPAMEVLYKKNGFVFLRRVDSPQSTPRVRTSY